MIRPPSQKSLLRIAKPRYALITGLLCVGVSFLTFAQAQQSTVEHSAQPSSSSIQLQPHIHGLEKAPAQNVSNRLNEVIQSLPKPFSEKDARDFYDYSGHTVKEGLEPFAYFTPDVKKSIDKTAQIWQLDYQITPGPQTKITTIHLMLSGEGANQLALQKLLEQAPFKKGKPFLSEAYENFKTTWLNTANDLGYIKATYVKHEVLINRKTHSAQITLILDTGPRYYFGPVHFSKSPLRDSFLQRYVNFSTGQAYAADKVNQLQTDLTNTPYFSSVAVTPQTDDAAKDHTVPITAHITMRPKQRYILGAGYGTDTGPRITAGSTWRYVNSYGHRFDTLLRLSKVQNTASMKYIIPGKHPLTDEYNINASLQTNNINQGNSQVRQVGTAYTLTRGNWQRWQRTFSLSYQIEHYNFFNNPYQTSHLLLPGFSLQNIVTNNPLFPTEAHRFNFSVIGAKQAIMADTSLIQAKISAKWIHSLSENNMIVLRNDTGYTAIHNLNLLPLSLNFFAGGSQSVRAYAYNNLGPGRYLFVGSAEYRYQVIPKWYASTFMDIGNAFNNFPTAPHHGLKSNLGAFYNSLQRGVGVGVVWNSPVGAMELTFAKGVTRPDRSNKIQFNMGTDF